MEGCQLAPGGPGFPLLTGGVRAPHACTIRRQSQVPREGLPGYGLAGFFVAGA